MRILVLNQYFPPDLAASSQLLDELCEDLAARHDVWVVAGRPSYNVPGDKSDARRQLRFLVRERRGDVRVLRMWSTSFARASMAGRILNYLTYLASCSIGALRTPRPDVVLTWTDPPPVGLIGALVARVRRVPFVLACQDITPEAPIITGDLSNPLFIRLLAASAHRIFRSADAVVSIGRDMNRRLEALGVPAAKIHLIPNWFDGSLVAPLHAPSAFRAEHSWDGRFVVMHSGNMGLGQDLDTLIEAAAILAQDRGDKGDNNDDVLIAIVGEGAAKQRLVAEASRRNLANIAFLPFQPKAMLANSLTSPDVHLISHKQGLSGFQVPSKLYGILASGRPVIAAVDADSEIAAVVEEAKCGVRVDPGDAPGLARAITEMRQQDLGGMGANGRAALERRFDRHIATSHYAELLEELAVSQAGST